MSPGSLSSGGKCPGIASGCPAGFGAGCPAGLGSGCPAGFGSGRPPASSSWWSRCSSGPGSVPRLFDQRGPRPPVRRERIGGPTRIAERDEQPGPGAFAQWVLGGKADAERARFRQPAGRQVRIGQPLPHRPVQLDEPGDLRLVRRGDETLEGFATPQRQRRPELFDCRRRVAGVERFRTGRQQRLELVRVQLTRLDPDPVRARTALDPLTAVARRWQQLAELPDIRAHVALGRRGQLLIRPERVDQLGDADPAVGFEQQHGQQGPGFAGTDVVDGHGPVDLHRSQHTKQHVGFPSHRLDTSAADHHRSPHRAIDFRGHLTRTRPLPPRFRPPAILRATSAIFNRSMVTGETSWTSGRARATCPSAGGASEIPSRSGSLRPPGPRAEH